MALRRGVWWGRAGIVSGVVMMVGRVSGMVGARRRGRREQVVIFGGVGVWWFAPQGRRFWHGTLLKPKIAWVFCQFHVTSFPDQILDTVQK